jgi:hypothetical protein
MREWLLEDRAHRGAEAQRFAAVDVAVFAPGGAAYARAGETSPAPPGRGRGIAGLEGRSQFGGTGNEKERRQRPAAVLGWRNEANCVVVGEREWPRGIRAQFG